MRKPTPEEQALWPTPNFDNPEQIYKPVVGAAVATFILASLCLCARVLSRKLIHQNLQADDYLLIAAMTLAVPMSILPLVCLNLGLGLHVWDQRPEWSIKYAKLGFTSDVLFPMACSLTKASQCLSYLHLFPGRFNKVFCHFMVIYITIYAIVCVFIALLQCRPLGAYWDPKTGLECMDMRAALAAISAMNSFSDVMIYMRPVKPLLELRTLAKQRLGMLLLLAVSSLPCIAGLLRLYYVEVFYDSVDELWNASIVWALMMLEMNLGVVCGCLFSIQSILAMLFPRFFASAYPWNDRALPLRARRHESDQPESQRSFQSYPLVDLPSRAYKTQTAEADTFEALWTPGGTGSSYASASSSGRKRGELFIPGVIAVHTEFTVQEEITPCHSPCSALDRQLQSITDAGSEEWTMEEVLMKL